MVVAVAEDCGGDGDGVAENSLRRVAAAIDLGLNFFDHDASAAFDRFHITQIFGVYVAFPSYSRSSLADARLIKRKGDPSV